LNKTFYTKTKLFWIVFIFLLTLKTHRTHIGQGDEPHYIIMAESLYLDRDIDVTNNYHSPYLLTVKEKDWHTFKYKPGKNPPVHPVGMPLLGVPIYALAHGIIKAGMALGRFKEQDERWIFIKNTFSISMMATLSFFSLFLFSIFKKATGSHKFGWRLALIFSLSPPLMSYGLVFFTDLPSAVIITFLFWSLINDKKLSWGKAFWIGYLPLLHPRNGLLAGAFLLLFLFNEIYPARKNWRAIPWLPIGFLSGMTVLLWGGALLYNYLLWENISLAGFYPYLGIKTFYWKCLPEAVPALFFDRSFGIFWINILTIFSVGGFLIFWRENRRESVYTGLILLLYLAGLSNFKFWSGGWAPPGRYMVPVTPILCFLSGIMIHRLWSQKTWKWIFSILFIWTGICSALYWQAPQLIWNYDVNRFLNYWFGPVERIFQDFKPDFFLSFPTPQIMAAFYLVIVLLINCLGYKDYRKSFNKKSQRHSRSTSG